MYTLGVGVTQEMVRELLKPYDIDTNDCIIWNGTLNGAGYPYLHKDYRSYLVTRLVLWIDGRLDSNKDKRLACHKCNNPRCINKKHLYAGTKSSNSFDSKRSGTHYMGNRDTCSSDHVYTKENTRIYRGVRYCRTCHNIYMKRYRDKNG